MKYFKTTAQAALLAGTILALGGCDTVNGGMQSLGSGISNLHFSNPFKSDEGDSGNTKITVPTDQLNPAMNDPSCPPVNVVNELRSLNQFSDELAPRADNKVSAITIKDVSSTCTHNATNTAVDIDVTFNGSLGPQAHPGHTQQPSFAYPYFVALTMPDDTIVAKEVYTVTASYALDQQAATLHEHLHQVIPLKDAAHTPRNLVVGFQLTDSQLAYNRSLLGIQNVAAQPVPAVASKPLKAADKPKVKPKPKHKKVVKKKVVVKPKPVPTAAAAPETGFVPVTTTPDTAPAAAVSPVTQTPTPTTQDIVIPAQPTPGTATTSTPASQPVITTTTTITPAPTTVTPLPPTTPTTSAVPTTGVVVPLPEAVQTQVPTPPPATMPAATSTATQPAVTRPSTIYLAAPPSNNSTNNTTTP